MCMLRLAMDKQNTVTINFLTNLIINTRKNFPQGVKCVCSKERCRVNEIRPKREGGRGEYLM